MVSDTADGKSSYFFQPDIQESVRFHVVIHSLPLVKFRAPRRDARRTLSSPARRASHFFSYVRLRATILGSSANHRTTCQLACFARLSTGEASIQKLASRCASASWWFMWDGGLVHSCNYRRCKTFVGQNKSKKTTMRPAQKCVRVPSAAFLVVIPRPHTPARVRKCAFPSEQRAL